MPAIVWLFPKLAAAVFATAGIIFFADPSPLSRLLVEWGYGRNFARVFGTFALATAVFLWIPQLRPWALQLPPSFCSAPRSSYSSAGDICTRCRAFFCSARFPFRSRTSEEGPA